MGRFDEPYLHYGMSHGVSGWLKKHCAMRGGGRRLIRSRKPRDSNCAICSRKTSLSETCCETLSCSFPLFGGRPCDSFYVYFLRRGLLDRLRRTCLCRHADDLEAIIAIEAYARIRQGAGRPRESSMPRGV